MENQKTPGSELAGATIAEAIARSVGKTKAVAPQPDLIADEKRQLENDRLAAENERLRDELERERDLHSLRKAAFIALFVLILAWLGFVLWYIWLAARYSNVPMVWPNDVPIFPTPYSFKLSDGVLIAFITSTTVSVIGIFLIAARWLFPAPKSPEKAPSTKNPRSSKKEKTEPD